MLIAVLLSLAVLSCANALKPKIPSSWPVQTEWLLLPSKPSLNYGARGSNFEVVPTLRLIPMTSMLIDQVSVYPGSYVHEGDVILTASVWRAGDARPTVYEIVSPISGSVSIVHVQQKEVVPANKPLMDIIEQELHARPIPFHPGPLPQPINPTYGRQPYRPRPYGYDNSGIVRGDRSGESTDLNMLP